MKKLFLFLLLSFGLTTISFANYLDSWSNNDLCGWMESSSTPKYISDEVKNRDVSCSRGVESTTSSSEPSIDTDAYGNPVIVVDSNGNPIMPASDQPTSLPDLPVESEHGTVFPSVDPSLMPATKPDGGSGSGSGSGSDDKPAERLTPIV